MHQPKKAMVDGPNGITPASELATSYSSGWWQLFSCSPDRSGIILDQGMPYWVGLMEEATQCLKSVYKQSETMTKAFEGLLDILCEYGLEEAAVILDEFRIH